VIEQVEVLVAGSVRLSPLRGRSSGRSRPPP